MGVEDLGGGAVLGEARDGAIDQRAAAVLRGHSGARAVLRARDRVRVALLGGSVGRPRGSHVRRRFHAAHGVDRHFRGAAVARQRRGPGLSGRDWTVGRDHGGGGAAGRRTVDGVRAHV